MRYLNLFICFYDTLHLITNIRSNWQKGKKQTLKLEDPIQAVIAKRPDLIHIFKLENDSFLKLRRLNYATLSLSNFGKQKVYLAINIFSEKTI